jgi:hypothetical protein
MHAHLRCSWQPFSDVRIELFPAVATRPAASNNDCLPADYPPESLSVHFR